MGLEKNPQPGLALEFFGPTIEFLTLPDDDRNDFIIARGTIPPGGAVPLHSHADTEDFMVLAGTLDALKYDHGQHDWVRLKVGDFVHVPGGEPHAWRNAGSEPVITLIMMTRKLASFFIEAGRPVTDGPQPVTPEDLARFAKISAKYEYWNATPEENAAIGLELSF